MHHPQCIDRATQSGELPNTFEVGMCRLGQKGHCRKCPHRGQRDPRAAKVARLRSLAYSVSRGYPHELVLERDPELASILWPEDERKWIASEGFWAKRAGYHSSLATDGLIRELLREVHDLKVAVEEPVQEREAVA